MKAYGERNGRSKAPDALVRKVCSDYRPGEFGFKRVAQKYALPKSTVTCWITEQRRPFKDLQAASKSGKGAGNAEAVRRETSAPAQS